MVGEGVGEVVGIGVDFGARMELEETVSRLGIGLRVRVKG